MARFGTAIVNVGDISSDEITGKSGHESNVYVSEAWNLWDISYILLSL